MNPIFTDDNSARRHLEKIRWPEGPVCPHCGNVDQAKIIKLKGKSTRPGLYQCKECREPFTVTVGTVMERSHIPLSKWVYAFHLMAASKKGVSAHQLHRMLGITYKSAWFMAHRIREAMRPATVSGPLGGEGKVVEADETYIGRWKPPVDPKTGKPWGDKTSRLLEAVHRNAYWPPVAREARRSLPLVGFAFGEGFLCGVGGVLSARLNASSRRRAASLGG